MKNRDFTIDGFMFHVNDNWWKNEFEGKYKLVCSSDGIKWYSVCSVSTLKEAHERAQEHYKEYLRWL